MRYSWIFAGTVVLVGCSRDFSASPGFGEGEGGTGGAPTTVPDAGSGGAPLLDAVGPAPTCCVEDATAPFKALAWVKIVAEPAEIGSCPAGTTPTFEAHAEMGPTPPHTCGECSCSPAACSLPEGIHTNAATCADAAGSFEVPFGPDPAAGWEGECSAEGALPAGLQCGGEPCAQSVSIPAIPIAPCEAQSGPAPPFPTVAWGRTALGCTLDPLSGEDCAPGEVCAPQPAPEGFALCVYAEGEHPLCPSGYPARSVFFRGAEDSRACEACQCAAQEGADCAAVVSVFSDAACGAFAGGVVVTDEEAACFDVVDGTALAGMEASLVVGVAGSCAASGGAPTGGLSPNDPVTLCCQGHPEAPG